MKYSKFATTLVSGVLALSLGLVGCGGGGSDTTTETKKEETVEVEEETTGEEEEVDTTTGKSTKKDEKATEAEEEAESEDVAALEAEVDEWADAAAWMGFNEAGECLYYIESTTNGSAMMVIYDPETNEFITFIGSATNDGTQVTITDEESGVALTFEVTGADEDDNLTIDMGKDSGGEAVLASSEPAEVFEAMMAIAEGGTYIDFNATKEEVNQWADTSAYMGLDEAGEGIYYIESTTDGSAMMVILDPETGEYVSFVGQAVADGTSVTITDETTGLAFTFEVTAADEDGNLVVNMGEDSGGEAVLVPSTIEEVFEAIQQINDNGTAVA